MPRKAREKNCEAIYHIMCRSLSEILLFCDNKDKDYYLSLLKRYSDEYICSIYAFCLMDNHLHIHLDPRGCDVSKFMHSVNTAYVRYYNKKYMRHGHLFQERFESRMLDSDEYNLTVSSYIHNNAKDIKGYSGREEYYRYSSYGIYLGVIKDHLKIIDMSFIMGLFNLKSKKLFIKKYYEFVSRSRDEETFEKQKQKLSGSVKNEYISGRQVIIRDRDPSRIVTYISDKLFFKQKYEVSTVINGENNNKVKAFTVYVLRALCGLRYKEICSRIYNITVSGCSRLCGKGFELINDNSFFSEIFNDLIKRIDLAC